MNGEKRRIAYQVANDRDGGLNQHFAGVVTLKAKSAGTEEGRFLRPIFDFAIKKLYRAIVLNERPALKIACVDLRMNRRFVVFDGADNVACAVQKVTFYFDVAPVAVLFGVFNHRTHEARLSVRTHPEVDNFRSCKFDRIDIYDNTPACIDVLALKAYPKVRIVFIGVVDRLKQIVDQRQVVVKALKVARHQRLNLRVRLYDLCAPAVRSPDVFSVRVCRLKQCPADRIEGLQALPKKVAIFVGAIPAQFF